jgi:hypothetical protein
MILPLDTDISHRDRSVAGLLAESLTPVTPKPVPPVPWFLSITTAPGLKPLLLMLSLGGLGLSFLMGVRYEKQ